MKLRELTNSGTSPNHVRNNLGVFLWQQVHDILESNVSLVGYQTNRIEHTVEITTDIPILGHGSLNHLYCPVFVNARLFDAVFVQKKGHFSYIFGNLGVNMARHDGKCEE